MYSIESGAEKMTRTICPVCETAVPKDADFCPECGWEIDWSVGELIIDDPVELQKKAERKQRKLQHYRRLYQQAKHVERLEKRIAELEQELQKTRTMFEQRLNALEAAQPQNMLSHFRQGEFFNRK